MEELPHLGDGSNGAGSSRGAFLYLPSAGVTTTTTSAPPPPRSAVYEQSYYYYPTSHPYFHTPPPKAEAASSQFLTSTVETLSQGVISQSDIEEIKARIMSHPRYSTLLGAFVDCQKVSPNSFASCESYCEMLIKYREELTRPLQEATDFLKKMESQFNALTNTSTRGIFSSGIPKSTH
ncbi:hypothetical protein BHM03_00034248 [Ensete ventricosum]|nr:hypothetical protein BHM03_00034248 [Ensete ventricosum]